MTADRRTTVPSLAELMRGNELRDSALERVLFGGGDETQALTRESAADIECEPEVA